MLSTLSEHFPIINRTSTGILSTNSTSWSIDADDGYA
jgi:hypothetical protein